MIPDTAGSKFAYRRYLLLAAIVASAAIALHAPGQVSMDTSVELYEAHIGRSASWNPPFMSAVMRWLGGGELATTGLVFINSLVTYLSLALLLESVLKRRFAEVQAGPASWRVALCLCLIANPVVFVYVGIVWKDVLFGSALIGGVALAVAAAAEESRRRYWSYAIAAMVVLAAAEKIRQQGLFMAPLLATLPLVAVIKGRGLDRRQCWVRGSVLAGIFACGVLVFGFAVSRTIVEPGAGGQSTSIGFSRIMDFDVAGVICRSKSHLDVPPVTISPAERDALCSSYSSSRVDSLFGNAMAAHWLYGMSEEQRRHNWWTVVRSDPRAFVDHRLAVFANILDVSGISQALPVHVGIDVAGNTTYLSVVGMSEKQGARAELVYRIASSFYNWPIYRHWFYVFLLLGGVGVICFVQLPKRMKAMAIVISLAAGLLCFSYLPTGISSDFRYLYGNILLISALWLIILAGSFRIDRVETLASTESEN